MTKEEALALKPGTLLYVIDDTRASMLSERGEQNSPLVRTGLQTIVLGERRDKHSLKTFIFEGSGYLINFSSQRNIAPEFLYTDRNEALAAFTAYVERMKEKLHATIAQLDARVQEAEALALETV